jgi:YD repeat-containing protein
MRSQSRSYPEMTNLQKTIRIEARCWKPIVRRVSLLAALTLIIFSNLARAQVVNITDTTNAPIPGSGHEYLGLVNETVNPANGSLSVSIPIQVPKGRGLTLPFSINYNSNGAATIVDTDSGPNFSSVGDTYSTNGWSYSNPLLTLRHTEVDTSSGNCYWNEGYIFYDPTGTPHALHLTPVDAPLSLPQCYPSVNSVLSGGDYAYSAITGPDATMLDQTQVVDADGTTYTFSAGNYASYSIGGGTSVFVANPSKIEDRNGNEIMFPLSGGANYTDTVGRTPLTFSGNQISVSGLSASYIVTWQEKPMGYSVPFVLLSGQPGTCDSVAPAGSQTSTNVITSIQLPNGKTYTFSYDPIYGVLDKITYPTGAWVSYDWNLYPQYAEGTFTGQNQVLGTTIIDYTHCAYYYGMVMISGRHVSFDGQHEALTQSYFYGSYGSKSTRIETTDDALGTSYTTTYTYGGMIDIPNTLPLKVDYSPIASSTPVEQSIVYKDVNSAVLQTVNKTWTAQNGYPTIPPFVASEQTIVGTSGPTSQVNYTYGQGAVLTEKDEYGYGVSPPATPTRKTVTAYQAFAATKAYPAAPSIFDRPCSNITYDNGSEVSETDYLYDGGSTPCVPAGTLSTQIVGGLPSGTHDEGNYSPNSTSARGNAAAVTALCLAGCTSSTTTYTYDETGQVLSMIAPCGKSPCSDMVGTNHTTSYSYADKYSSGTPPGGTNTNAYLTTITDPLGHSANFTYSYNDGQLTSATDPNKQTTHYIYNTPPSGCSFPDGLDRLSEIDYPDQGKTTYCYDDAVPSITTSKLMNASNQWMTSVATMDGMGHVIQTQLTSDPQGTDTVTTTYNGSGRVSTVSNPHWPTSLPTDGTTTYYYDALGRQIELVESDNSILQWCYNGVANCSAHMGGISGTWVDSTDERENHWQRTSDSFGRLTEVMEPSGTAQSPSMETDYSYNALNNLLSVNQKGNGTSDTPRLRRFSYDSLSRLLSAANPESGTTTYTYDADGNVMTKTVAGGATTNFTYDALGRILSKSYSNDSSATPASCFQYDIPVSTASDPYPIGRMTLEWTQAGSCPNPLSAQTALPSGALTGTVVVSHDPMGRISSEQQCTPDKCTPASGAGVSYAYDLIGDTTGLTNSVGAAGGPLTLTALFDGAAHMTSLTSSWAQYPTNLYTLAPPPNGYGPVGPLKWNLGPNLSVTQGYTNRLWVNSITATGQVP